MNMSYEAFDKLEEALMKIENIDPFWLPTEEDIQERIDVQREEDIVFLIWISLTAKEISCSEDAGRRRAVMRKLYETLILTE